MNKLTQTEFNSFSLVNPSELILFVVNEKCLPLTNISDE